MPTPHPRRRALAELDARIAQAEAAQAQRLAAAQAQPASKRAAHLATVAVRTGEERLTMLRQSRAALTGEEPAPRSSGQAAG